MCIRDSVITSSVEHPAVLNTCQYLSERHGLEITRLPVDRYGRISLEDLQKAVKETTILVSIMHANNEIGTIQPIAEVGRVLRKINEKRKEKIYFHTDAVQSVGKLQIDVRKLNLDFLSFSAHKFYGPKGVGGFYAREGSVFDPLLHGGHHENNMRASTENFIGAFGMAKAMESAYDGLEDEIAKLEKLRAMLEGGIFGKIHGVRLNGHPAERLPGTTNVSFEHVEGESIVVALDLKHVAVSTGSACTSGASEPSHVIKAIDCPPELARSAIRFSLGTFNTEDEVSYLLKILPPIVKKLRRISPVKK